MATVEKLENNRVKLTITIDAPTFEEGLKKAYVKTGKQFAVPGFRKGKAPRKVIEKMYGETVFFDEAIDEIWGEAYDAALNEHDLAAVDQPKLDMKKVSLEEGIEFTAEVQLEPEVKLGQYKGIEVEEPEYTVTDADVEAELKEEQEKNARYIDVDRAVEDGDRVGLDYSGSVDGEKFEGGTAEDQVLVIGSKMFIPGFEEQIIGMKSGEEKDLTVTFPKEYHAENLAGKEAVFHVHIKQIQVKEVPAMDDEFAKDISSFDTLDELKADLRKKLEEQAALNKKTAIDNEALKAACRNAELVIPECMIERQVNFMIRDIAYRLAGSGMKFEDYLKYTGTSLEDLKKSYHDEAEDRVRLQLVVSAVAKEEQCVCSDEDLENSIKEYAEQNGLVAEDFKKGLTDDDKEFLSDREVSKKAVEIITSSAKVVAAKKAKKPAAKKAAKKASDEDAAEEKAEGGEETEA